MRIAAAMRPTDLFAGSLLVLVATGSLVLARPASATPVFADGFEASAAGVHFVNEPGNLIQTTFEEPIFLVDFHVNRPPGGSGPLTVGLRPTAHGTAIVGVDYSLSLAAAHWEAGETGIKKLTVMPLSDPLPEPVEWAVLELHVTAGTDPVGQPREVELRLFDTNLPEDHLIGASVEIPGVLQEQQMGLLSLGSNLRATNSGAYMMVRRGDASEWVYRLSGRTWRNWEFTDIWNGIVHKYHPQSLHHEHPDVFSVSFTGSDTYGSVAMNTGTPAFSESPLPTLAWCADPPEHIAADGSAFRYQWALCNSKTSGILSLAIQAHTQDFSHVVDVRGLFGELEPGPEGAVMWVNTDEAVYRATSSGALWRYAIADLHPQAEYPYVRKIRFGGGYTFFAIDQRIFRVDSAGDISLFHTIQPPRTRLRGRRTTPVHGRRRRGHGGYRRCAGQVHPGRNADHRDAAAADRLAASTGDLHQWSDRDRRTPGVRASGR
jgi:hypothetical protein